MKRADKNNEGFSVTTRIDNPIEAMPLDERALPL